MTKLIFILGSPNGPAGDLSSISINRIDAALRLQQRHANSTILATGGFGEHFNVTDTAHREWVHRYLRTSGGSFDPARPDDLLSSNTVEDVRMILEFTKARGSRDYLIVTSSFHMPRCQYIFSCLEPLGPAQFCEAQDPLDLSRELLLHESEAFARLKAQEGVFLDGERCPYPH